MPEVAETHVRFEYEDGHLHQVELPKGLIVPTGKTLDAHMGGEGNAIARWYRRRHFQQGHGDIIAFRVQSSSHFIDPIDRIRLLLEDE